MARMLPTAIHPDVKSRAERRIFNILQAADGTARWTCLHSLGLGSHEQQRSGEIDFLLICETGVFVLEVKGGRVTRDGGTWKFKDRFGNVRASSRSPFEQARGAMCELERRVREHFGRDSRPSRLLFGYGVIAPDCRLRPEVQNHEGGENPLLVYDVDDRGHPFRRYVDRLSQATRATQHNARLAPTDEDAAALVDFLRGNFDAVVPLSAMAEDVSAQIQALESQQYAVLDGLNDLPRSVIRGAAGTGKTILALESARRAAWTGKRTLLLCFNKLLASHLRSCLTPLNHGHVVHVAHIHGFLHRLITGSGQKAELEAALAARPADLFDRVYPELGALAAMESAEAPFDALIVDEAQDMMTPAMLDLFDVLVGGGLEAGFWRVFLDCNNQAAVYGRFEPAAFERIVRFGQLSVLTLNCRNTRQIADETRMLTVPQTFAQALVDGGPVEYIWYRTPDEQMAKIDAAIRRLTAREGVFPGRITLLSGRQETPLQSWTFCNSRMRGLDEVTAADVMSGNCNSVTFGTVPSFKGLENDFVILTGIDRLDGDWWRSVCYVGMSRAKARLFLVLPDTLRDSYNLRLQNWLLQSGCAT